MAKRKCTHMFACHAIVGDRIVSKHCAVPRCNERLSIGPANDADVPADEIIAAVCAHSDADHAAIEEDGAFNWDPAMPLAEQWPWNGASLHDHAMDRMDRIESMLDGVRVEMTKDDVEQYIALTGPTDKGQPVTELEHYNCPDPCKACDASVTAYLDALDGVELPRVESDIQAMERPPVSTDAFEPADYASTQPWADPSTTTRLTDDELVKTVAYAPPGSVQE